MKKWLHEIYSITSKLRLYIIAIFIAGICSMIIGAFLSYTHTAPTWVQAQFNPAGAIVEANSLSTSGFIFSILGRNIFLSGIFIFTSPLQLGILDLISFLGTLFQMGGQIIWFNEGKNRLLLNGLGVFIPHAIFEVPAVILTTAISLKIGRTMIKPETSRRDALKKRFQEAIKLFPLIVVLLVIAAVTEGEVSLPRATAAVEKTLLNQATKTVSDDAEQWVIQVPIDWQQEDLGRLESGPNVVRLFSETEPLSVFVRRTEVSSGNDERKSILNLIASQVNNNTSYDFVSRPEAIMLNGQPAIRFTYWITLNERRDFNISYAVVSLSDRNGEANLFRIDAVMPDKWADVSDNLMQKIEETFNLKN